MKNQITKNPIKDSIKDPINDLLRHKLLELIPKLQELINDYQCLIQNQFETIKIFNILNVE